VPVIGIFTKLDGRRTKVMTSVLGNTPNLSDILSPPPQVEQGITGFIGDLEKKFKDTEHPPSAFIKLESTYFLIN
jgi:hypothetical protein